MIESQPCTQEEQLPGVEKSLACSDPSSPSRGIASAPPDAPPAAVSALVTSQPGGPSDTSAEPSHDVGTAAGNRPHTDHPLKNAWAAVPDPRLDTCRGLLMKSGKHPNVRFVHNDLYKPDSDYAQKPPPWFIGRAVKVAFKSVLWRVIENLWVVIEEVAPDGRLIGTLDNDPAILQHVRSGDQVIVDRNKILAVKLTLEEWRQEVNQLKAQEDYSNRYDGPPEGAAFEKLFAEQISPRLALELWRDRPPGKELAQVWQ